MKNENKPKELQEAKSLRWLANMFPFIENSKDETDKMSNAINVYCTAGANKIDELQKNVYELTYQNNMNLIHPEFPSFKKYNVVALYYNIKSKNTFYKIKEELILEGNIVIELYDTDQLNNEKISEDMITVLKEMNKQKIDMVNEIFVIDVDNNIKQNTKSEIDYAISKGKKISYLENDND